MGSYHKLPVDLTLKSAGAVSYRLDALLELIKFVIDNVFYGFDQDVEFYCLDTGEAHSGMH